MEFWDTAAAIKTQSEKRHPHEYATRTAGGLKYYQDPSWKAANDPLRQAVRVRTIQEIPVIDFYGVFIPIIRDHIMAEGRRSGRFYFVNGPVNVDRGKIKM